MRINKEESAHCRNSKKKEKTHPCLLLSMSRGATARMYVQVQISKRITSRRDWKLKSADCAYVVGACQFEPSGSGL